MFCYSSFRLFILDDRSSLMFEIIIEIISCKFCIISIWYESELIE